MSSKSNGTRKTESPLIAMGIDPGLLGCGMAVVRVQPGLLPVLVASKTVVTKSNLDRIERICEVADQAEALCKEHCPIVVGIEDFVQFKGKQVSQKAWNVSREIGAFYRLSRYARIRELNPMEWVVSIVGSELPMPQGGGSGSHTKAYETVIRSCCSCHMGWTDDTASRLEIHEIDAICIAIVAASEALILRQLQTKTDREPTIRLPSAYRAMPQKEYRRRTRRWK